jgi:hypothetical protein
MKVKERLVLGAKRFQVIHRVQGEDKVVTQIPYSNIARVSLQGENTTMTIGIDLIDLAEPNSFEKRDAFETNKQVNGFHYVIYVGYVQPLETIHEMLKAKLEQAEAERE